MDRVLVAEDEIGFQTVIKSVLKKYEDRFETVIVNDGMEAIDALQKKDFSLLVTDLKMPRVAGLVLLSYMNRNCPHVPCIVMTSLHKPHLKEKLAKDVLHYIEKPFDTEKFADLILTALKPEIYKGRLKGISIPSFLELIEIERKSCILEVEGPDGRKGRFFFKDGKLHNATFGDLSGKNAAVEMIRLENANVDFLNLPSGIHRNMEVELTDLVMEAILE